jgi:AcrR family transcriptional regulator
MTKHRKKEEWIEQILDAAASQVVEEGYSKLTMEGIAARTSLSKAGVYRYFGNKRDVALALFQRVYMHSADFDFDEVLAWNLPTGETIQRLLTVRRENELRQEHNIWVQLIPKTLWDEGFRQERKRLMQMFQEKFELLIRRIADRDGLTICPDREEEFKRHVLVGVLLREGMIFQSALGLPAEEQGQLYRQFIEVFFKEVFGKKKESSI